MQIAREFGSIPQSGTQTEEEKGKKVTSDVLFFGFFPCFVLARETTRTHKHIDVSRRRHVVWTRPKKFGPLAPDKRHLSPGLGWAALDRRGGPVFITAVKHHGKVGRERRKLSVIGAIVNGEFRWDSVWDVARVIGAARMRAKRFRSVRRCLFSRKRK